MAGAKYGLFLGILLVTLGSTAPQPAGSFALCMLLAIDFAIGAVVLWRRTGMWLSAISWVMCAVWFASVALVVLVQQTDFNQALASIPWLVVGPIVAIPSLLLEQRVHAEAWQRWADHMKRCSLRDMLLFRHIPDLRAR